MKGEYDYLLLINHTSIIMTPKEKMNEAKKRGIDFPEDLFERKPVCVYGFFAIKNSEEFCFYIGKTTNLYTRLFDSSDGHIHRVLYNRLDKLVPRDMSKLIDEEYSIEVRVLEEVDYKDTSFSRAAHRLALAELTQIVSFQKRDQCLTQLPEGIGDNEENYWKKLYEIC